jgi:hypothetical protein
MKKLFLDEEDDMRYLHATRKVISKEQDPQKKEFMMYVYKKMIKSDPPYDSLYKEIKNIQKHSLLELGEQARKILNKSLKDMGDEKENPDDFDETPEEIIDTITDPWYKSVAKQMLINMRQQHFPMAAQIDFLIDLKAGRLPGYKKPGTEKQNTKEGKPEKVSPKDAVKAILKRLPGYIDTPSKETFNTKVEEYLKANKNKKDLKDEKDLYTGFDDIK